MFDRSRTACGQENIAALQAIDADRAIGRGQRQVAARSQERADGAADARSCGRGEIAAGADRRRRAFAEIVADIDLVAGFDGEIARYVEQSCGLPIDADRAVAAQRCVAADIDRPIGRRDIDAAGRDVGVVVRRIGDAVGFGIEAGEVDRAVGADLDPASERAARDQRRIAKVHRAGTRLGCERFDDDTPAAVGEDRAVRAVAAVAARVDIAVAADAAVARCARHADVDRRTRRTDRAAIGKQMDDAARARPAIAAIAAGAARYFTIEGAVAAIAAGAAARERDRPAIRAGEGERRIFARDGFDRAAGAIAALATIGADGVQEEGGIAVAAASAGAAGQEVGLGDRRRAVGARRLDARGAAGCRAAVSARAVIAGSAAAAERRGVEHDAERSGVEIGHDQLGKAARRRAAVVTDRAIAAKPARRRRARGQRVSDPDRRGEVDRRRPAGAGSAAAADADTRRRAEAARIVTVAAVAADSASVRDQVAGVDRSVGYGDRCLTAHTRAAIAAVARCYPEAAEIAAAAAAATRIGRQRAGIDRDRSVDDDRRGAALSIAAIARRLNRVREIVVAITAFAAETFGVGGCGRCAEAAARQGHGRGAADTVAGAGQRRAAISVGGDRHVAEARVAAGLRIADGAALAGAATGPGLAAETVGRQGEAACAQRAVAQRDDDIAADAIGRANAPAAGRFNIAIAAAVGVGRKVAERHSAAVQHLDQRVAAEAHRDRAASGIGVAARIAAHRQPDRSGQIDRPALGVKPDEAAETVGAADAVAALSIGIEAAELARVGGADAAAAQRKKVDVAALCGPGRARRIGRAAVGGQIIIARTDRSAVGVDEDVAAVARSAARRHREAAEAAAVGGQLQHAVGGDRPAARRVDADAAALAVADILAARNDAAGAELDIEGAVDRCTIAGGEGDCAA